jgi:hypothetical protein
MDDLGRNPEGQAQAEGIADPELLKKILSTHTGELAALAAGARLALRAPIGLAAAVIYGLVSGLVGYSVLQVAIGVKETDPAMVDLWGNVALFVGAITSLYAIIQFTKRDRVSRASWWPALFAVPALLLAIAFSLETSGQSRQLGPVVLSLFLNAWTLLWASFGGAAAAIFWVRSGHGAIEGKPAGVGQLLDEVRTRLLDVAGPHGARVHAVTIGMQFLLPGIFYALQLAFTDMIAVLDPDRPVLRRAGQLSTGMRGRLFRLLFVWWLLGTLLTMGVSMPLEGVTTFEGVLEKFQELMLDPSSASRLTLVVQEILWAVCTWVLTLALLVLYLEREGQVRAKMALKKLRAQQEGAPAQPLYNEAALKEPNSP